MQSFGERVLMLRRRKGFTQKELAEQVGLSPNTIARVERHLVKTLQGDTIAVLARTLSTSADFLLGLTEEDTARELFATARAGDSAESLAVDVPRSPTLPYRPLDTPRPPC